MFLLDALRGGGGGGLLLAGAFLGGDAVGGAVGFVSVVVVGGFGGGSGFGLGLGGAFFLWFFGCGVVGGVVGSVGIVVVGGNGFGFGFGGALLGIGAGGRGSFGATRDAGGGHDVVLLEGALRELVLEDGLKVGLSGIFVLVFGHGGELVPIDLKGNHQMSMFQDRCDLIQGPRKKKRDRDDTCRM